MAQIPKVGYLCSYFISDINYEVWGGLAGLLQCLLLFPPHYANILSSRELYSLAERGLLTAVPSPFYLNAAKLIKIYTTYYIIILC